jgi:purine-binding chemotaxis protein CheW
MSTDDGTRMLVFRLGGERFALPLAAVDEVVEMPEVQPLPDSSSTVLGIATMRGELVSIYDPRALLHAGDGRYGAALLFSTGNRRVGVAIDDVFDPILVEADAVRPAPGMDAADGMLQGVVRRGADLIGVLDADALLRALSGSEER